MCARFSHLLWLLCLPLFLCAADPNGQTICLNMIVKDEKDVICRCLASVKPVIDYWVIVDTGSSDGTQEIIRAFMKEIPGELHERPWINFGHNRNEALELAKGKADYVWIIDADEVLAKEPGFQLPVLDKDYYFITTSFGGTRYGRLQLINNHIPWKWMDVLHEHLESPIAQSHGQLTGIMNVVSTDGARSKDPKKFEKDAAILEEALTKEPLHSRYRFYLAQSYRDAGLLEKSLENYQKRVEMGGWDQEVFWSLFQIAILQESLERPPAQVIESYYHAYQFRPSRAETLYRLASYYRRKNHYHEGYLAARKGLNIPPSDDVLFVEKWIYDYGLMLEYSICAYWIEKYQEAKIASLYLLAHPDSPEHIRACAKQNLVWIDKKLNDSALEADFKPMVLNP